MCRLAVASQRLLLQSLHLLFFLLVGFHLGACEIAAHAYRQSQKGEGV